MGNNVIKPRSSFPKEPSSRGSSVITVTGRPRNWIPITGRGKKCFCSPHIIQTHCGAHEAPVPKTLGVPSLGGKRRDREAYDSSLIVKVRSAWSYTSMAWCLIEHRDSFSVIVRQEVSKLRQDKTLSTISGPCKLSCEPPVENTKSALM
jgi:hypothetical protein